VFIPVTLASLGSGALHHYFGWSGVNLTILPLVAIILLSAWALRRTAVLASPR
jgi:heme exporter protein D